MHQIFTEKRLRIIYSLGHLDKTMYIPLIKQFQIFVPGNSNEIYILLEYTIYAYIIIYYALRTSRPQGYWLCQLAVRLTISIGGGGLGGGGGGG